MIRLRTRLDVAPLFVALGWLAACGPAKTDTETTGASESGTTAGTGTTSAATTAGTSTSPTTGAPDACAGEVVQLMQSDVDPPAPSGFVRCDDGIVHRPAALECLVPATPSSCPPDASPGGCFTNDDCTDMPFGSCKVLVSVGGIGATTGATTTGGTGPSCACVYGCRTDADCPEGQLCRCAGPELGPATTCIPAACSEDADCPGELCGATADVCAEGLVSAACTTPMDECDGDSDCGFEPCIFEVNKWVCNNSVCGRPFVVDAAPVTAPAAARDDWRGLVAAPSAPAALRPRLAAHYTAIALGEHASVASFAGFILQLLALGAPPALVQAAQQALADEIEHARVAFALASLYGGTGVGPGPLPLPPALPAGDVDAIVAAVIAEACVAETLAGLELQEAAARAHEPALAAALAKIAGDEERHAALGWRFVQWALAHAGADRGRAAAAFAEAIARAEHDLQDMSEAPGAPELRGHGVIDAPLRAAVRRRGLAGLVRPAATRLCAA
jgi:Cys-rich repeat protein